MSRLLQSTKALKTFVSLIIALVLSSCASNSNRPSAKAESQPQTASAVEAEFSEVVALMRAGEDDKALQRLQALARSHPKLPAVHANIGLVKLRNEQVGDAVAAFETAVELAPANERYWNHLGLSYRRQGRLDEARQAYEQALEMTPQYADAHRNLGILYDLYLGEAAKAEAHYRRAMELDPASRKEIAAWLAELQRRAEVAP